jgi:predicted nucleotidyltransferase
VEINSNFKDLLRLLNDAGVRYLVVGGYAVMKYTEPYNTKDLDIWIEATPENATRALEALRRFGAPAKGVTEEDFLNPDLVYQVGVEPVRVDVMSRVSGLDFPSAWDHRSEARFDEVIAPVLSIDDLIRAKRAAGRAKDRLQARQLEKAKALKRDRGAT